jgi:hypothetical protein
LTASAREKFRFPNVSNVRVWQSTESMIALVNIENNGTLKKFSLKHSFIPFGSVTVIDG